MSDFLFSSRRRASGELRDLLQSYLGPVTQEIEEHHGEWGSVAVARAPHDARSVRDDGEFISVLIGEPIVRSPAGASGAASADPHQVLHSLLRSGRDQPWDQLLDGPFAALGIDRKSGGGLLVSDLAGFIPVFAAEEARPQGAGLVLGTHLDCVAWAAGRNRSLDLVSAADLLIHQTCTFPHTVFSGVEQFSPASARRFASSGGWEGPARAYWEPVEERFPGTLPEAAAVLRECLVEDVRAACGTHARVGILLSGGEDARAVLGAIPPGVGVQGFVFADWENREVRIARAVARAHGAELTFGRRHPDHYLQGFEPVASLVGSGQLFMDVHGYGFHQALSIGDLPVVLGGLSSDAFLKGIHEPGEDSAQAPRLPPASAVRAELREAVIARRTEFRHRLRSVRPESAAEWERIWPFSMRVHAANFHGNRRLFASHEPFHCTGVVKLAAAVPRGWKRHRRLFHRAVRPLLVRTWYVPHSRWRYPYFGPVANLALTVGLRVARGVRAVATGQVRASHGPWPKWGRVVRSEATARKQAEYSVWDTELRSIFSAGSPEEVARSVRAEWHPLRELMLLQLSYLARRAGEA